MNQENLERRPRLKDVELLVKSLDFPKGSLGFSLVSILEGRERPAWLFETELEEASHVGLYLSPGITDILRRESGMTTIASLLSKTEEELLEIQGIGPKRLKTILLRVESFYKSLQVTPEAKLLRVIFGFLPGEEEQFLSTEDEKRLKDDIGKALSSLREREAEILTLRFGLEDWRRKSLEEVAEKYGVTRERIFQIEVKALRKLRYPRISRDLRRYLPSSDTILNPSSNC